MATATTHPRIPLARRTSVYLTSQKEPMYTVLVVEDERDIREVLRRYLERKGISVLTAGTGAESRHMARLEGQVLPLTPSEWGLLVSMAAAPHGGFTRRELIERVSGHTFEGYERD